MISVVIALAAGLALGVAGSALYVARGHAIGWLVVQHRAAEVEKVSTYGSLPPSWPIGAGTVGREVESRWSARSEARTYDLDAAERLRTITAGPDGVIRGEVER